MSALERRFRLENEFKQTLRSAPVQWGFGDLSRVTFLRTYAWQREQLPELYGEGAQGQESWADCCIRVIEGAFTRWRDHMREIGTVFDAQEAQGLAQSMCRAMHLFQWMPPGRGLRQMGTPYVMERDGSPLYNCAFVSTQDIARDLGAPFAWTFNSLMMGTGVGFDTRGAATLTLQAPAQATHPFRVRDSREGWVDALTSVFRAYTGRGVLHTGLDVEGVRKKGAPIRGFGGKASGPEPLVKAYRRLIGLCEAHVGRPVTSAFIVDAMNVIASCVVSGGIRRSALIALGAHDDHEFIALKSDPVMLNRWRWASNNSILGESGMSYDALAQHAAHNGEPGLVRMDLMRSFGRMCDAKTTHDSAIMGVNPCAEMGLEHKEQCNVVEIPAPHNHTKADFLRSARFAFIYGKLTSLFPSFDEETVRIMSRNRRVGVSVTGVAQMLEAHTKEDFAQWLEEAYAQIQQTDRELSAMLRVPLSVKTTTVKPSGTVSLVAGVTPGVHFDHAPQYIRRVRFSENSALLQPLRDAGYHVEPDEYADATYCVDFLVNTGTSKGKSDATLREKLDLAAYMQHHWSDNSVSCTADFTPHDAESAGEVDPRDVEMIRNALIDYDGKLKTMSFLKASPGVYAQAPYETITRERYDEMSARIRPLRIGEDTAHEADDLFCDGAACEVSF